MRSEGNFAGNYRMPAIGEESLVQSAEHLFSIDDQHNISVTSPLWPEVYVIGDGSTFKDPRVDSFLRVFTLHQFHHLTTRQLSLTERYETRPGASRYSRLGHMIDSAKLLQDLGATFEQQVQTIISDPAHPAGSHLRGDFLVGDYDKQDTHDGDLWSYLQRSGLIKTLQDASLVDSDGFLAGSPVKLETLADPRNPRHEDIVECERPHPNADRLQFTFHEGTLTHPKDIIQEALKSLIRVETPVGERMAFTDPEAARLLFILAVRHQTESWAEPLHRLQEEFSLMVDRYIFASDSPVSGIRELQDYYPVDYARIDEISWQERIDCFAGLDPFIANAIKLAHALARDQQSKLMKYIGNDHAYQGPDAPDGTTVVRASSRHKKTISISGENELWIALPKPKYRGGINSLVVTGNGLKPIVEIDPQLLEYEESRRLWMAPLLAKVVISSDLAKEIRTGIKVIEAHWGKGSGSRNPANRPAMPSEQLEEQIRRSRERVFREARV